RYGLFYTLAILFGARKQVFITFGPWVLIRVYEQGADTIAQLVMASTFLSVLLLPMVGRLIDRWGERVVLMADALLLLVVCLTYGFAGDVFSHRVAFACVCGAFVLDLFLFGVQMARTTYLSKVAAARRDISSTLGLGVTLDHAVAIPIAMLGGRLWVAAGSHRPVFIAAAGVALATLVASSFIRIPREQDAEAVTAGEA
ncbi:MAG: MFS transporter, partial [Planctomycetota bacterium]